MANFFDGVWKALTHPVDEAKFIVKKSAKVTKDIFIVLAICFRVQSHIVDSSKPQYRQFVLLVEPGFQFELRIGESRQERQVEHIKQEL